MLLRDMSQHIGNRSGVTPPLRNIDLDGSVHHEQPVTLHLIRVAVVDVNLANRSVSEVSDPS